MLLNGLLARVNVSPEALGDGVAVEELSMANHGSRIVNTPVEREIERIVTRAARGMGFLRAGEQAYLLSKAYPNCGLTGTELVIEISSAAARAGVAVEIHHPRRMAT